MAPDRGLQCVHMLHKKKKKNYAFMRKYKKQKLSENIENRNFEDINEMHANL